MIFIIIESLNNKIVRHVKSLNTKKGREKYNQFIIEGEKFINNITIDWNIKFFIFSESMSKKIDIKYYSNRSKVYILKDKIFKYISDTITPQGALALCEKRIYEFDNIISKKSPFFLIVENLNDPGNLGTLIRTSDAAGVDAIFISKNSVEVYNKKVIRATAGSIFNVPIFDGMDIINILKECKSRKIITLAGDLQGEDIIYDLKLNNGCAIIIGNEARGISGNLLNIIDYKVKIPILGKVESLNASIASGILIYEVVRQNIKKLKGDIL